MDAELKIASDEACRYASELSQLTGQDVTAVITEALKTALERERRERDMDDEVERMLAFGQEIRASIPGPVSSNLDDLYDDITGLPKRSSTLRRCLPSYSPSRTRDALRGRFLGIHGG